MKLSEKERRLKALELYKAIYGEYPEECIPGLAPSGAELEPLDVLPYLTEENIKKGLEAEEYVEKLLRQNFGDNLIDMRFHERLTRINNQILDAIEGRGFHRWEREEGIRGMRLLDLLEKLKGLIESEEALSIIEEIASRFDGLDGKEINKLHGELKGTKMDWIACKDGDVYLFDAKRWNGYSPFKVQKRLYDHYFQFRKIGISFFLLIWNESDGRIYWHEVIDPSDFKPDGKYYIIPRKLLV